MIKACRINCGDGSISGCIYKSTEKKHEPGCLFLLPLGEERKGTLRLFHECAVKLAAGNHSCLVFDYPCTGDSSGDFGSLTFSDIILGIHTAGKFLINSFNLSDLVLISARSSSLFVEPGLLDFEFKVSRNIMFEPESNGQSWLNESARRSSFRNTDNPGRGKAGGTYIDGFEYSKNLFESLGTLTLNNQSTPKPAQSTIFQIGHRSTPSRKMQILSDRLEANLICIKFPPFWLETGRINFDLLIEYLANEVNRVKI
ncbi:MAG: alpha/beta hydrolase family protein [Planctomycetota bacterium]|jgi:hypothetical protein